MPGKKSKDNKDCCNQFHFYYIAVIRTYALVSVDLKVDGFNRTVYKFFTT